MSSPLVHQGLHGQGLLWGLGFHVCPSKGHPPAISRGFLSRYMPQPDDGRAEINGACLPQRFPPHLSSLYVLVNPNVHAHFLFLKEDSAGRARFLFPVRTGARQLQVFEQSLHFNSASFVHPLFCQAPRRDLGTGI